MKLKYFLFLFQNPLLNGSDLSTVIGRGTGDASFDDTGVAKYQNRRTVIFYS